jgi:hypothetical protein
MKKISMILILLISLFMLSSCSEKEEEIEEVKMTYFSVKKEDKFGAINQLGEEVIPFIYDHLSPFTAFGVALAMDSGGKHLINLENEVIATHDEIIIVIERYRYLPRIPERPRFFEASDSDMKYLYNQKGEQILSLPKDELKFSVIHEEYLLIQLSEQRLYIFDLPHVRIDLMDLYDTITPFDKGDGYLATKGDVYSFLDQDFQVLNEVNQENRIMFEYNNLVLSRETSATQISKIYVYSKEGVLIGNPLGYDNLPDPFSTEQFIIYNNSSHLLFGIDHTSGLSVANPVYYQVMMHEDGLMTGINQNYITDFYDGTEKIFSRENPEFGTVFKKADDNLYVISYGTNDFEFRLGMHYVDREGNLVSGNYKYAESFNQHGLAIIADQEYNHYLINRDFEVISDAYTHITYDLDMDMFFAVNSFDEERTSYILDGIGNLKNTFEGNLNRFKNWLILIDINDLDEVVFLNMFYIANDYEVYEPKDIDQEMLKTIKELDLMENYPLNIHDYFIEIFFDVKTKDSSYTYVKELYDGYYVFSVDGRYVIMNSDLVSVGTELYDDVSTLPSQDSIFNITY